MNRVLKCFVTPTLTYTAQVDEGVLHICIKTQQVIDYMCCSCSVSTSGNSRIFFKRFVTPTLTYAAQVDESVLHVCFDTLQVTYYMCCTCFVSTPIESRIKMHCYADFNIYRSSRRKWVTYLY